MIDSNKATAIRTVVIVSLRLVWHSPTTNRCPRVSKRTWIFLVPSGLATGLSGLCYFPALQLGEASQVAPVDKLSVVVP